MATSTNEDIWKILAKYCIKPDSPDPELLCVVCKNILIQPRVALCGCGYCLDCFTNHVKDGNQNCFGQKPNCKSSLIDTENVFGDDRIVFKISKIVVKCPGQTCEYRTKLENMAEHMEKCEKQPMFLGNYRNKVENFQLEEKMEKLEKILLKIGSNQAESQVTTDEMSKYIIEVLNIVTELKHNKKEPFLALQKRSDEQVQEIKTNNKEITNLNKKFDENFYKFDKILNKIETRLDKVHLENKSIDKLERAVAKIESNQACGEYVWCIKNWDSKIKEAIGRDVPEIYSDPFHSHKNGYKMCLELNPIGVDKGNRTHLSLYICIMPGEFDNILEWPFPHGVQLDLLEPKSGKAYVSQKVTRDEQPNHVAWTKPTIGRNVGVGFDEFIEVGKLTPNGSLCLDNQIWIRAIFLKSKKSNFRA